MPANIELEIQAKSISPDFTKNEQAETLSQTLIRIVGQEQKHAHQGLYALDRSDSLVIPSGMDDETLAQIQDHWNRLKAGYQNWQRPVYFLAHSDKATQTQMKFSARADRLEAGEARLHFMELQGVHVPIIIDVYAYDKKLVFRDKPALLEPEDRERLMGIITSDISNADILTKQRQLLELWVSAADPEAKADILLALEQLHEPEVVEDHNVGMEYLQREELFALWLVEQHPEIIQSLFTDAPVEATRLMSMEEMQEWNAMLDNVAKNQQIGIRTLIGAPGSFEYFEYDVQPTANRQRQLVRTLLNTEGDILVDNNSIYQSRAIPLYVQRNGKPIGGLIFNTDDMFGMTGHKLFHGFFNDVIPFRRHQNIK